jgi:hypothetical protein
MYYKQEIGDTKGKDARDQGLFCTLMRENLLLFTASSSHTAEHNWFITILPSGAICFTLGWAGRLP